MRALLTVEVDVTVFRDRQLVDAAQKRTLSGSGRADECFGLAFIDTKRYRFENLQIAVGFGEVLNPENGSVTHVSVTSLLPNPGIRTFFSTSW